MEIIVAKSAGFCFGVNNAVKLVFNLLDNNNESIYMFGPIIHNNQVVERLKAKGAKEIENINEVEEGGHVVIRAHGVTPEIYKSINDKGLIPEDATCPYVKKIHNLVKEKSNEGYRIIILGDKKHPEVIGINGWCNNNSYIVDSEEDIDVIEASDEKVCVVAQTTLKKEKWNNLNDKLKNKFENILTFNTICTATSTRQNEAEEIAKNVDIMIIIGGSNSSNTQKLYEICKKHCFMTYKVETSGELPPVDIKKIKKIGISAGASTPDWVIEEVIKKMSDLNNQELVDSKENEEEDVNFADVYESSFVKIHSGEIVKGKIIGFNNSEVFVDLGYKSDGIITLEEYTDEPDFKIDKNVKAGDEVEVLVLRVNDGEGNVSLSKKKVDAMKAWDGIVKAYEDKTPIKAIITEVVNGGVIASASGVRIFIPASQVSDRYVKDLNEFLKKTVEIRIIEYNDRKRKLVGSSRIILEEQKTVLADNIWSNIEVGKIFDGVVKSLTDFGAFVDIGGIDGLIHISELSWSRVKHPSQVLKVEDKVQVSILEFNKEKKKVSLGYRKQEDNPWFVASQKYQVGDVVNIKIVRFAPFGAFVELESGVDGLVHISQISNKRLAKPEDVLQIGMETQAKITEMDLEHKKISLSIKEVNPIDPETDDILPGEKTEGKSGEVEVAPSEHKEEMNLTLGDIMDKSE